MNLFIWLWLYSLVSAACDISHALWSPDYGETVIEDLSQALPGVGVKQFKTLNPGVNPNRIMSGETYTVPYGPEITIITPATWSRNCPKTLLLHGEEKAQDASTPSKPLTPPATAGSDLYTSQPTSGTMYDETITRISTSTGTGTGLITTTSSTSTSVSKEAENLTTASAEANSPTTGSHKTADTTDSKPAAQATTDVTTGTSKPATTKSGEIEAPTTGSCPCWTDCKLQKEDSTYSKKIGLAVAELFCNQFNEAPLAAKNPSKISEHSRFVVGAHISPGCTKSELDEAKCLEYLEEIENQCPRTGGFFERGCFYVWIMKRETT
ncbi:hypothetical protein IWW34DRAFT_641572 [Fusarium oxysporum f. sp. albedinis]|nr:hypothetical protein IWW34DRAFT_641572 [Fusarium oxysporum f. sp. albedinis]